MIVRIFKSSQPIALLLIPLIGLLLRLGIFFNDIPTDFPENYFMPYFEWIYSFTINFPIFSGVLAWVIVTLQAIYINYILEEQSLLPRKNYLFGFVYITIISYIPEFHYLNPAIVSSCFLIPAFNKMLVLSKQNSSISEAFDSAVLIGCASLIYLPGIVLYLVLVIALIYFKPMKIRLWLISFTGIILPPVFISVLQYWYGNYENYWDAVTQINFNSSSTQSLKDLKLLLPLIPLFSLAIPKYFSGSRGNTVRVRHIYNVSLILLISAISIPLFFSLNGFSFLIPFMLGSILMVAHYFYFESRNWLTDVNYLFLFISVIYVNYLM